MGKKFVVDWQMHNEENAQSEKKVVIQATQDGNNNNIVPNNLEHNFFEGIPFH